MTSIFEKFNARAGANDDELAACTRQIGKALPSDYVDFLKSANGGEGFIGEAYVILWGTDDLGEMNRAYQVEEYAPGFLLFGSDGGGEGFGFDMRDASWPVVQMPFVGMEWSLAIRVAESFNGFINYLVNHG